MPSSTPISVTQGSRGGGRSPFTPRSIGGSIGDTLIPETAWGDMTRAEKAQMKPINLGHQDYQERMDAYKAYGVKPPDNPSGFGGSGATPIVKIPKPGFEGSIGDYTKPISDVEDQPTPPTGLPQFGAIGNKISYPTWAGKESLDSQQLGLKPFNPGQSKRPRPPQAADTSKTIDYGTVSQSPLGLPSGSKSPIGGDTGDWGNDFQGQDYVEPGEFGPGGPGGYGAIPIPALPGMDTGTNLYDMAGKDLLCDPRDPNCYGKR